MHIITCTSSTPRITCLLCFLGKRRHNLLTLILFLCCFARILNLFAEENAVEDTIYYLSESLRKEAIDLEVFLKVTRQYYIKLFNSYTCNETEITLLATAKNSVTLCHLSRRNSD